MKHKSIFIIATVGLILVTLLFLLVPGTTLPPTQAHYQGTDAAGDKTGK